MELCYRGLGIADWREVVSAYATLEPSRPINLRGKSQQERQDIVAGLLRMAGPSHRSFMRDYNGERIHYDYSLAVKLGRFANHAAYAAWIGPTLRAPLEVWRHCDPRNPNSSLRRYYLAAYFGPDGVTSHQLIVAVRDRVLFNAYRLDGIGNANEARFGDFLHVGYDPIYPPLPTLKGAPFPDAPFGSGSL